MELVIDGRTIHAGESDTVLETATASGIDIPALCNFPGYENGVCRLCMVEINGSGKLQPACSTIVSEGMEVLTDTDEIRTYRKSLLSPYMREHGEHPEGQEEKCRLHTLSQEYKTSDTFEVKIEREPDNSHPAISFDPGLCIECRKCIIACNDEQGNDVLSLSGKGYASTVGFDNGKAMGESSCVSCGACVDVCPTGALIEKEWEPADRTVTTTCPYCAIGCQIDYGIKDEKIVWARASKNGGVNQGKLCVKGKFGYEFEMSRDRLTRPLIRKPGYPRGRLKDVSAGEVFREASWDEALTLMVDRMKQITELHGRNSIAGIASDRSTNEDIYAFQKLMRAVLKTDNLDQSATLCHSPSAAMLSWSLGAGASTNPIHDVMNSRTILVVGSNTDRAHPVLSSFIKKAARRGANLIVVDPRNVELAKKADLFLQLKPGTDVFLFSAMAKYIIETGLADRSYIENHAEGFSEYVTSLRKFKMEDAEKVTGIPVRDIEKAARTYALNKPSSIFWTLGITEHDNGSDNVSSLVNLAIITGNIGVIGGGLNPIRGQNNVQGGADVGGFPGSLPGYQDLRDPEIRERFERAWNTDLPHDMGWKSTEMIEETLKGNLKMMYVSGENSIRTHPNSQEVEEALKKLEMLVVQDIFLTETAEFADIILPAASSFEEYGTFTNTERRVQIVRPLFPPPGDARADWEIYADIAERMGYDLGFKDSGDIMKEISGLVPPWGGMSHEKLEKGGMQWPVPSLDSEGTPILHEGLPMRGKARMKPLNYNKEVDNRYPYTLITGRSREHYHTATMTSRSSVIGEISSGPSVEMNSDDMAKEGIMEDEEIEIASETGKIRARAVSSPDLPRGVMFTTFHFADLPANVLTSSVLDPITKTPAYKDTRVRVNRT